MKQNQNVLSSFVDVQGKFLLCNEVFSQYTGNSSGAEKELLYQASLLDSISDALISTDTAFKIKSWNKAAEHLYGFLAKEVMNKPLQQFITYEYFGTDKESAKKMLHQTGRWSGIVKYNRADGKQILLDASVTSVKNAAGETNGFIAVNRDITGSTSLEETIQNFYSAFSNLDAAFLFFDKELNIVYFNAAAKEMVRYAYGEEIKKGMNILHFLPAYRHEALRNCHAKVLAGEQIEYEIESPGTVMPVWMHCTYFPTKDAGQTINGLCAIIKNITVKKECEKLEKQNEAIEKKLFQSRLLFEQFMQNSPLVAWVTDAEGNMHYMNPTYQKTYGFTSEHFGKNIAELFDMPTAKEYSVNNQKVLKTGVAIETVERAIDNNGNEQVLKVYKFPLLINNRQMVGGWAVDMTDQVVMQEKLMKSIERHEYVNEATSDAIYDWNFTSGKLFTSARFEELFGYTEKQVSIRHRLRHIHPEDVAKFKEVVFQSLRNETSDKWEVEYRLQAADGTFKSLLDKAFIIRHTQKVTRVIGALQDITAQKELQQKLVNQEKKSKREFIKSVIETQEKERRGLSVELHDNVNQILASCKLMLEVALDNGPNAKMLTEKTYQSIQLVINEIRKISHHLNPSAIADVGLVEAIEQMIEKINLSGKLFVRFEVEEQTGLKALQEQDTITILRIVQEQLTNILKHAKAANIFISLRVENELIKLLIKDDGVGFDVEKCKKGLGLRNIYHRVEYYSGTMDIESSAGKGCALRITLNTKIKACLQSCTE